MRSLGRIAPAGWILFCLVLLLGVTGCGEHSSEGGSLAAELEEALATWSIEDSRLPCASAGECEPQDVSRLDVTRSDLLASNQAGAAYHVDETIPTVEELLEKGLRLMGASPAHVVVRGTATEGTVRCEWRGVARTLEQRETAIRLWLELDQNDDLPSAQEAERQFMEKLDSPLIAFPESAKANFRSLALGGLRTDYQFLTCYADYDVHEYIVGSGLASLTVAYDQMADAKSYALYSSAHAADEFGPSSSTPLLTEAEYEAALQEAVRDVEALLRAIFEGREAVVFLAPMGAHHAISVEVWQVVSQWDLQTDDHGAVNALRYGVPSDDAEYTQTLANLKSRVTAAAASDAFADVRTSNLTQYYRDIGAYGDITPDDGSTATFTPSQPPPVYAPAPTGLTVAASGIHGANLTWNSVTGKSGYRVQHRIGGDEDWTTLADIATGESYAATLLLCDTAHEFRVGAYGDGATYNTRVGLWSGAVTLRTAACGPQAPVFVDTPYSLQIDEDAAVGDAVGEVSAVDVNGDSVTYSITAGNSAGKFAIGGSSGEVTVAGALDYETTASYTLTVTASDGSGGTATATVSIGVGDVPEDPPPAPQDLEVSLSAGDFTIGWTAVSGASEYEIQYRTDPQSSWTALPTVTTSSVTYSPAGGPPCDATYEFRVRAYGDGDEYVTDWGTESPQVTQETEPCNLDPEFDSPGYSFTVAEDASVGADVGTVSATDEDTGDELGYEITAGNDDGTFEIDAETGEITAEDELSHAVSPTHTLTVEVDDGNGGTDTATVTVTVTSVCLNGVVIPSPDANPDLVGDCQVLYAARGALAGSGGSLDWDGETSLGSWEGVTILGTPGRVWRLQLANKGLDGSIPAALGSLGALRRIDLDDNSLTGQIPAELGNLARLTHLYLFDNGLTGRIPAELGNLSNLQVLYLEGNQLSGTIPAALGNLDRLTQLVLDDNRLSGSIPAELGDMDSLSELFLRDNSLTGRIPISLGRLELERVYLTGNSFSGCFPHNFRDVANHDLDHPDLDDLHDCPNRAPVFEESSYSFTVSRDATEGHAVGNVAAEDPDGRTVTYAISEGNDDDRFGIGAGTGRITVAGTLGPEDATSHRLTVQAQDAEGTTSDVGVTVNVRAGTPAGGTPTIGGTVQVGQTLTADTSGIIDPDGLTNVTYSYQWVRVDDGTDSDITDATGSTYTLVDADKGKTIKVRVSFTDDDGNAETLTSAATAAVAAGPNRAASGSPTISGTVQVGQVLTAVTSRISDPDGLANVTYSYQWVRVDEGTDSDIAGATSSTYTLVEADEDKTVKVRVSFTDDDGNAETLTSAATAAVAAGPNRPATGAPTISGTGQVGQVLTADTSGITDPDSLTNVTYSYQWVRVDDGSDSDIAGATSSTYTLVEADEDKTIKVRVSFTDDRGHAETLASAPTAAVAARPNRAASGSPTITGTVHVGQVLTADTSGITDADGLANVTYSFQWVRVDGGTDSDITGATSSTYALVEMDEDKTIKVRVSFTDDRGHAETLSSTPTAAVAARPNRAATGAPTISGTVQVGQVLTADTSGITDADGLTNVTYSYQWVRVDDGSDSDITDATGSTYALVEADEDKTVKVRVSFTDDRGHAETLTSAPTAAVAAAPVWSVEMTVVNFGGGDKGATSAEQFSNETGSYHIQWLWYSRSSRQLHLSFMEAVADADDLTLMVGDLSLAFPERSSNNSGFTFSDVDLSWSAGQKVMVSLLR